MARRNSQLHVRKRLVNVLLELPFGRYALHGAKVGLHARLASLLEEPRCRVRIECHLAHGDRQRALVTGHRRALRAAHRSTTLANEVDRCAVRLLKGHREHVVGSGGDGGDGVLGQRVELVRLHAGRDGESCHRRRHRVRQIRQHVQEKLIGHVDAAEKDLEQHLAHTLRQVEDGGPLELWRKRWQWRRRRRRRRRRRWSRRRRRQRRWRRRRGKRWWRGHRCRCKNQPDARILCLARSLITLCHSGCGESLARSVAAVTAAAVAIAAVFSGVDVVHLHLIGQRSLHRDR